MEPKLIVSCAVFPLLVTLFLVLLFEPNIFFFALIVVPYGYVTCQCHDADPRDFYPLR
jgi:hypothetical protein